MVYVLLTFFDLFILTHRYRLICCPCEPLYLVDEGDDANVDDVNHHLY